MIESGVHPIYPYFFKHITLGREYIKNYIYTIFTISPYELLKIDMRPKSVENAIEKGQDTGWEMREKFLKNGYKCKILGARSTRNYKEGPFRDIICAEYYLEGYDGIFACHFGRGATLGAAKYKNNLLSLPVVGYFGKRARGWKEKKRWLAICKEIIDREGKWEGIE